VNLHTQFARRPDGLLGGLQQGILDGADEDITVDALFALPEFQDGQKICVHILITASAGGRRPANKKAGRYASPTCARWPNQQTLPFLNRKNRSLTGRSQ